MKSCGRTRPRAYEPSERPPVLLVAAVVYSVIHFAVSGLWFALRVPNVGQVIEELQPLYRLFTAGAATVDHPRQYGPVFLFLFHPIYRLDLQDPTLLSRYALALDLTCHRHRLCRDVGRDSYLVENSRAGGDADDAAGHVSAVGQLQSALWRARDQERRVVGTGAHRRGRCRHCFARTIG